MTADRRIRDAWLTAAVHACGSALVLLATGVNVVLAAHLPLLSAAAILLLGLGVRAGSRVAALLLLLAVLTPAAIKLAVGALHAADLPAFPLAALYFRGLLGTLRLHRRAAAQERFFATPASDDPPLSAADPVPPRSSRYRASGTG
jgi:hypothetical protein